MLAEDAYWAAGGCGGRRPQRRRRVHRLPLLARQLGAAETPVYLTPADNAQTQRQLPALEQLVAQQIEEAERVIGLRRGQGMEAAADALRGKGPIEGRGITRRRAPDAGEELRLLELRNEDAKRRLAQARAVLVLGTVLGLLIAAAAGWSLQRRNSGRGQAEEALRDSEEQYRMLLDGVQDHAIFMLDPQGRIVSWNAGAERIQGYSAEQIIGRNFSCLFPAEDIQRGRPQEVLAIAAASGRHEEQGMRVRKDGSRFLANVTCTALRDPAGNLRGFTEISRDLSESKESGAKYRGLLEAAPDAMVVVNQGGEIVLLNRAGREAVRLPPRRTGRAEGKNIIPEGFAERLIADGPASPPRRLAQQIGSGIELTGRRKDGSEFPIEIMLSPLESAEGTLVTAAIRDISVRKDAEKHLAQMEGRYRGLLEAAPDAMVVVNQGGEIVLLNVQAEKQFGYRRDELVGQKVKNIIPEGFAERLIADGPAAPPRRLAQQIGTGIELTGRRKDGSEFPIEIMLSPLESAEGILVTAAIRDISVRKDAEKHLAQMEGRYRGLLEAAPDAMVVVNPGGEIVLLNVQAEKQFGYRRDELRGPEGEEHHSRGLRGTADRRRHLRSAEDALAQQIGSGHRAHRAAQGRQRVSDRDHAEPARERGGHAGDGGDPRHQRAQGRGKASGADGGPLPRAAGGGAGRDGGGEPGRRDRAAEPAGGEAVRLPPRRTARAEGDEHHPGGLRGTADRRRPALRRGRAGAADRHRDRAHRAAQGWQRVSRSRSC